MTTTLRHRAIAVALATWLGGARGAAAQPTAPAPAPPTTPPTTPPPVARPAQPSGPDMNAYYQVGADSLPQEGVPKGEIRGPFTLPAARPIPARSTPTGSTSRRSTIRDVPRSLMVFQDGQAFKDEKGDMRAQNVMDNLIYRREIPVMIGVFINPGRTPDQPEPTPPELGRPRHQPADRVQLARRQVRPRDHRRADAGALRRSTTSRRTPSCTASAARAPARSRRSRWPGSGPTSSARC